METLQLKFFQVISGYEVLQQILLFIALLQTPKPANVCHHCIFLAIKSPPCNSGSDTDMDG